MHVIRKKDKTMEKYSKYSDSELLALMRQSKPVSDMAFQELYRKYSAKIRSYCIYKVSGKDCCEDIFQQTWIKFYQSVTRGKELESVLPFLLSIAGNLIIDYYRSCGSRRMHLDDGIDITDLAQIAVPNAMQSVECSEISNLINSAVNCLDDIYREAFILKRFEGLTLEQIADVCGISISAAKQRVSRSTMLVRNYLAPFVKDYIKVQ